MLHFFCPAIALPTKHFSIPDVKKKFTQIDLDGKITSGIKPLKDFDNVGNGELTKEIRTLYPDIDQIKFVRLRKKGKKEGDRGTSRGELGSDATRRN